MSKEKTIVELREEKKQLREASQGIIDAARGEKRAVTAEERAILEQNQVRMSELDLEIEERIDALHSLHNRQPQGESRSFSLRRSINNVVTGRAQDDPEREVLERGAARGTELGTEGAQLHVPFTVTERRDALTAAGGLTAGTVDIENRDIVLPLTNSLVLAQAGATLLTGLRGKVQFPTMGGVTVKWEGENEEADDGTPTMGDPIALTPHRMAAVIVLSRQLLLQENQDIEGYIRRLISVAVAQKLEASVLGKGNTGLTGMFYSLTSAIKDNFSWARLVDMETEVNTAGGLKDSLAYLIHPSLLGASKTTAKEGTTGAGGLIINSGDALLNGYKVFNTANIPGDLTVTAAVGSTPAVTGAGALFGNFRDMVLANWGNLDITVDPYTLASYNQVRLVVNTYWDYGILHAGSFKAAALHV